MNCALPERAALEFFWSRLSPGGVVLMDDYTCFGHASQTEAIDSWPLGWDAKFWRCRPGRG